MRGRRKGSNKVYKQRTWEQIKEFVAKGSQLDYEEEQNGTIRAFVRKGDTEFFVNLFPPNIGHVVGMADTNDADYQDFIDTYKDPVDTNPPADVEHVMDPLTGVAAPVWKQPYAGDGKVRVLASHKPVVTGKEAYNFFTSVGDDNVNQVVGSGTPLMVEATSGTPLVSVDIHFSTDLDPFELVYLFGGALSWENAGWGDMIDVEIRGNATPVVPDPPAGGLGLDVDYNMDGERLVYAGPGSGTHALGGYPIWIPNFKNQGHFNLDKVNMVPVPASGSGAFDWYPTEQFIGHYVSGLLVYGTSANPIIIDATESAPLPHGYWIRMIAHNNSNTDWKLWGFMKLYRERLK